MYRVFTLVTTILLGFNAQASAYSAGNNHSHKPVDRVIEFKQQKIKLVNPKVRAAKKTQNSAAFVVVKNECGENCKIIKAHSPVAEFTELHTSFEERGVHKMRPVQYIYLPENGEAVLKSGGYHVMLLGLKQDLEVGKEIPITLELSNGNTIESNYLITECCGHCH